MANIYVTTIMQSVRLLMVSLDSFMCSEVLTTTRWQWHAKSSQMIHFLAVDEEAMSCCQRGIFLIRWRRMCFARWSLRMNRCEQIEQEKFFSPVWVRRCLDNSSDLENFLSQSFHWQTNGFSPGKNNGSHFIIILYKLIKTMLHKYIKYQNDQSFNPQSPRRSSHSMMGLYFS